MRMPRTKPMKKSQGPNHAARVNVSERKHFLWRWYCRKKHKNVKYRGLYSYRQRVRVITLFPNIFSYCFCVLSDFAKVFERKVWRVQVSHLHNAARALSSPSRCFSIDNKSWQDFFCYLWYCDKKNKIEMWFYRGTGENFHWFGINWHVFIQSECRNCCLYVIRKSRHKQNLENISKYGFFPRFRGKKWRRSEHAHASYPGLFFRPLGFSPYMGREERRVQGLD